MMIFVLIPGIFCGLWADLSMCLSLFIQNKFVIIIVPYLFLFFEKAFFDTIFSNRISLELSPSTLCAEGIEQYLYCCGNFGCDVYSQLASHGLEVRMMMFFNIVRCDIKNGILKKWKTYLFTGILFSLLAVFASLVLTLHCE